MGPDWHFEGRRRLVWMHDRVKPNGYIEFGAEGVLRTSLCPGGRGTWELRATGEMVLTFGKCYHLVFLLDAVQGRATPSVRATRACYEGRLSAPGQKDWPRNERRLGYAIIMCFSWMRSKGLTT